MSLPATDKAPHGPTIGTRIKTLRESKSMPLSALAAKAKISTAMMSRIEESHTPPGLVTLANISKALNVNMDFFFAETKSIETIELTRKEDRVSVHRKSSAVPGDAHYDYQALSCRLKGKKLETFMARFDEDPAVAPLPVSHHGEEFCFCLEGMIDFTTHEQTIRLRPGDSLHFFSRTPHVFKRAGSEKAKAIFILLPE